MAATKKKNSRDPIVFRNRRRSTVNRRLRMEVDLRIDLLGMPGVRGGRVRLTKISSVRRVRNGYSSPGQAERESVARMWARETDLDKLAYLLTALGHLQRLAILFKLMEGEATHRLLAKTTKLKAGPLYYHLRELRSTGLIGPKVRDVYSITNNGQKILLTVIALGKLIS